MAETRAQFWQRRGSELQRMRKNYLCTLYRSLGGLGGKYPPEKWRKDELASSIVDIEWARMPDGEKLPDPPRLTPPCDVCGRGSFAVAHRYGGEHHYRYTADPEAKWVPESEEEAERLEQLAAEPVTEKEILANPPFPPASVRGVDGSRVGV